MLLITEAGPASAPGPASVSEYHLQAATRYGRMLPNHILWSMSLDLLCWCSYFSFSDGSSPETCSETVPQPPVCCVHFFNIFPEASLSGKPCGSCLPAILAEHKPPQVRGCFEFVCSAFVPAAVGTSAWRSYAACLPMLDSERSVAV